MARSILTPKPSTIISQKVQFLRKCSEDVAGDYCDVIALPDGACLAVVADVAGHGVPAALSAAMLKAYVQDAAEHHHDPGEILRFLNHRLTGISQTDNFATMLVLVVSPDRSTIHYASAGHDPGWLMRNDGQIEHLPSTGLVLGPFTDARWIVESRDVQPGDRFVLATDGVSEAMNEKEQLFGRQRLAGEIQRCHGSAIEECAVRLRHSLNDHCGSRAPTDDMTLLALEIGGKGHDPHPREATVRSGRAATALPRAGPSPGDASRTQ